ncbi:MAG: SCO family protein [Chitinophagaceae bacterium]|jgi:protein SCO1/2|nr:SCO family protein [Chitinophagaceae bacterium]
MMNKMKRKWLFYLVFFVLLLGGFLFFVFNGTDYWKGKSPTISYVRPFTFLTQDGKTFTEKNMEGKVCVVEYFFTTCKVFCPRLNTNMRGIYNEFKNEPDFLILSFTCDPEIDTVAQLKHFADSLQVDTNKWVFLTGRKDSLYNTARESFLLDDPKNALQNINDQFIHTQFFALIDKKGNVRAQVYDGLKKPEIELLKKEIKRLLKE